MSTMNTFESRFLFTPLRALSLILVLAGAASGAFITTQIATLPSDSPTKIDPNKIFETEKSSNDIQPAIDILGNVKLGKISSKILSTSKDKTEGDNNAAKHFRQRFIDFATLNNLTSDQTQELMSEFEKVSEIATHKIRTKQVKELLIEDVISATLTAKQSALDAAKLEESVVQAKKAGLTTALISVAAATAFLILMLVLLSIERKLTPRPPQ